MRTPEAREGLIAAVRSEVEKEGYERLVAAIRSEVEQEGYGPKVAERAVALIDTAVFEDPWDYIFIALKEMVNEARNGKPRRSP